VVQSPEVQRSEQEEEEEEEEAKPRLKRDVDRPTTFNKVSEKYT